MNDKKNPETLGTKGESAFAQEERAGAGTGAGAATAPAAATVTDEDYAFYRNGQLFTNWLNQRIGEKPGVAIRHDNRDLVVVELQADGLACHERGTEVKYLVPLDERALNMILPQVIKK